MNGQFLFGFAKIQQINTTKKTKTKKCKCMHFKGSVYFKFVYTHAHRHTHTHTFAFEPAHIYINICAFMYKLCI